MNDQTIESLNKIFDLGDMVDTGTGEVIDSAPLPVSEVVSELPILNLPIEGELVIEAKPEEGLQTATTQAIGEVIDEEDVEEKHRKQAEEDYEFSRGAIKSIAVDTQGLLHRAIDVANQTDAARSFEVAGELVKSVLEAHRELRELHKTATAGAMGGRGKPKNDAQVNIQNGIVFNGTPEELLRIIQPERQ